MYPVPLLIISTVIFSPSTFVKASAATPLASFGSENVITPSFTKLITGRSSLIIFLYSIVPIPLTPTAAVAVTPDVGAIIFGDSVYPNPAVLTVDIVVLLAALTTAVIPPEESTDSIIISGLTDEFSIVTSGILLYPEPWLFSLICILLLLVISMLPFAVD